jgi:hypothetical protein
MSPTKMALDLLNLARDAVATPREDIQLAKDVLALFVDSGLAAGMLKDSLTPDAAEFAQDSVDIEEEAKLGVLATEADITTAKQKLGGP